jgi:hypothetical protein
MGTIDIRQYVMSPDGPSEKLSEFFCNLMEEEREIIDNIYSHLPKEVTNQIENVILNTEIEIGKKTALVGGTLLSPVLWPITVPYGVITGAKNGAKSDGIIGAIKGGAIEGFKGFFPGKKGYEYVNNRVANKEKEETLKAIENSFKQSIEIITEKVMNKYREENDINYELIKGYQLSELIENLDKKIIRPKEENFNIIDIFEKFIYGNTPLYTSCMKSFELFESVNNSTKILLIVSDGLLNDINNIEEAQKKIKEKIEDCEIITICIYLNSSNNCNQKQFYNEIQPQFDSGAKFLFNISSGLDYHNSIIKFFLKKDWNIPLNGRCKLFIEINNSKDLNQFIELLNQALDDKEYNKPIDKINTIIGNLLLDKIVEENYIKQLDSKDQKNEPLCWAYSLSTVIYLRNCSIFGRKIEKFEDILKKVKEEKKRNFGDGKVLNQDYPIIFKSILEAFKLKCNEVDSKQARYAVMKGRPCLCIMYLKETSRDFFNQFFEKDENKKKIFTKETFKKNNNMKNPEYKGHVVVLTSIEKNCLKFLNSYGKIGEILDILD